MPDSQAGDGFSPLTETRRPSSPFHQDGPTKRAGVVAVQREPELTDLEDLEERLQLGPKLVLAHDGRTVGRRFLRVPREGQPPGARPGDALKHLSKTREIPRPNAVVDPSVEHDVERSTEVHPRRVADAKVDVDPRPLRLVFRTADCEIDQIDRSHLIPATRQFDRVRAGPASDLEDGLTGQQTGVEDTDQFRARAPRIPGRIARRIRLFELSTGQADSPVNLEMPMERRILRSSLSKPRGLREDYIDWGRMRPHMSKGPPRADLEARTKASRAYADRARRSLPGGVTAGVKYFDPYPIAMKKAKGCRLWDLDGNEYIDYCLSFGPLVLGHGHPRVMKAIRDSLRSAGTTMFGTPHELEATYAERLLRIFRPDGRMRFTMSGTEATLHAVRIARAYRKRPMIAKFEGHFHGGVDEFLVSHTPSRDETRKGLVPISGSRGTPEHVLKNTLVLPFNDLDETAARIRSHADRLACVILEPIERSYIAPDPEFLKGLREITADHDIPLIFDEVMSGFRVAFGGAQHAYRVTPDLTCLGKIIGGGLPCGAFLGRPDILDLADPVRGDFFQSSTFAGYPIAMAAGMATLDELEKPGAFDGLLETTRTLTSGFERHLKEHGVPAVVPGVGSVFSILFMNHAPRNYRDSLEADEAKRSVLDTSLLARGIFVKPGKPFYVSAAHDNIAIRETLDAFEESLSGPA